MKISVALAAYNGEQYIEEQLDSIRLQTMKADEVIVVDDASSDRTWEILLDYQEQYPDFPLQLFRNSENRGFQNNFLTALTECSGELQFLADQDDVWEEDKLAIMAELFRTTPDMQVLASTFSLMDAEGNALEVRLRKGWSNQNLYHARVEKNGLKKVPVEDLIWHNFCQGAAQAFRAEVREKFITSFNEYLPHDRQINLIGAAEKGLYFYNRPLFRYRIHASNALGLKSRAGMKEKLGNDYRTMEAREAYASLAMVRKYYPAVYAESRFLRRADAFLGENIRCMEEGKTLKLLRQGLGRDYRSLKSGKGILGDLLFSVRRR